MKDSKRLFDLVDKLYADNGEFLFSIHIIDISEYDSVGYRVYHSDGYCIEVFKDEGNDDEYDGLIDGCSYNFIGDLYDGFSDIDCISFFNKINCFE